jgi:hypothetical protein
MCAAGAYVCFSNRPVWVKRFQTFHRCGVDVACGLVLLFGIGTMALPVWDSRMRGTIFGSALPSSDGRSKQTCDLTSSIVPRGTSFHRAVELGFSYWV